MPFAAADPFILLALAIALDALVGEPRWPTHPVVLMGRLIDALERQLNPIGGTAVWRQGGGIVTLAVTLTAALFAGAALAVLANALPFGAVLEVALVAWLLSGRSLHDHVAAVARALRRDGLAGGRRAVSMIVGRDPRALDEAGVARGAIESCAENFSDGVVAPALWYLIGGLPGLFAYKALNTADSMIAHRSARHGAHGWAAARLDDLANLPASRLSALLLVLAALALPGGRPGAAWRACRRDAAKHKSPNAGWPEAATAGALGLRLNGPKRYAGRLRPDAWMGDGRAESDAGDIERALALYRLAVIALALIAGGVGLLRYLL